MLKKLFIFSIVLSAVKINCMENPNSAKPIDEIVADTNGILAIPDEILLPIIKICVEDTQNEHELKKIILKLGQINKRFRQLIQDRQVLLFGFIRLNTFKQKFYSNNNGPKYKSLNYEDLKLTKQKLLLRLIGFEKNKNNNISSYNKISNKNEELVALSKNNNLDLITLLLCNGADGKSKEASSGLLTAVNCGHIETLKLLLENGANVNSVAATSGNSALMLATLNGYIELVEFLIKNGAYVNLQNFNSRSPIHIAATMGYKEIIEILVKNKANIDAQDKDGDTALILAANYSYKEIVEILIKNGANINIANNNGYTAITLAKTSHYLTFPRQKHKSDILQILKDAQKVDRNENKKNDSCLIS